MHTVNGLSTGLQLGGQHTPGLTAGGVINSYDANGSTVRPLTLQSNGGNVGIGTTNPDRYRLMVSGGDTRFAGIGQEQSLFGLDRLVGLNDLRFYVDDTGNTEVMHLGATGLRVNGNLSLGGKLAVDGVLMTINPVSDQEAKDILSSYGDGAAIIGSAGGVREKRLDFYFKQGGTVYRAKLFGDQI